MQPTTTHEGSASLEERRRRRHEARASATYREFLKRASTELGLPPAQSEPVVAAVLGALEQRLPFDEMKDLASQLPSNLRELLASCEDEPGPRPLPREIGQAEFLAKVARALQIGPDQVEAYVRAVFRLLTETVSEGEIEQVIHLLPHGLRILWPPRR